MESYGLRSNKGVGWMDTPQTVMTTKAPAMLKMNIVFRQGHLFHRAGQIIPVLLGEVA